MVDETYWTMISGAGPLLIEVADLLPIAEGDVLVSSRADGTVSQCSTMMLEESARVLAQALRGALATLALAEHNINIEKGTSEAMRRFSGN